MGGSTQADKTQTQHFFANSFLLSPQLFHKEVSMAIETKRGYFPRWTEKTGGVIAPDERLPWGQSILVGLQHVLAMFGSTVLGPILMGFNPNTAIFFSGVGTLIFFLYELSPRYKKRSILPLKRVSCLIQVVQYSKI